MPKRKATTATAQSAVSKKAKKIEQFDDETFKNRLKQIEYEINKSSNNIHTVHLAEKLHDEFKTDQTRLNQLIVTIFNTLINQRDIHDKFIQLLRPKINKLSNEQLLSCLDKIFEHLKTIKQQMMPNLHDLCRLIIQEINKDLENDQVKMKLNENISSLFEIQFNETLSLTLLDIFKKLIFTSEQASLFIKRLFNETEFKWQAINLSEFFHKLIPFCTIYKQSCSQIIKCVINYFQNINTQDIDYLQKKSMYNEAEVIAINSIVKLLKSDRVASDEFLLYIKTILDENCKNRSFTRFTISLVLYLTQAINKTQRAKLVSILCTFIHKLAEIDQICIDNKWISCAMRIKQQKQLIKKFCNICEFHRLNEYLDVKIVYKSLVDISISLIETYGVSININIQPINIRQSLTCVATILLTNVFRNCNESREFILQKFLDNINKIVEYNESIEQKSSTVFVDQLYILFKSKNSKNYLQKQQNNDNLKSFIIKYLLKSAYTLNLNCLIRLLNIFDDYLQLMSNQNNTLIKRLIDLLKSNMNNDTDLITKKISIMGLMTILSNAKYDDKKSNENLHDIDLLLSIFNSIKNQLLIENDCDIKLWIYQSFNKLILTEYSVLIEPVLNFLSTRLNEFLNRTSIGAFIKLDNCISNVNLKLIEPLDALIHCTHVCYSTYKRLIDDERIRGDDRVIVDACNNHVEKIETMFNMMVNTLIDNDAKYLFSIYKKQTRLPPSKSTSQIKTLHQLQLGLIDALIEHEFFKHSYKNIMRLLEKYEQLSNLISIEIEDLMSPLIEARRIDVESAARRQRVALKRKRDEEDKENKLPGRIMPSLITPPATPARILSNLSFTNIKFDHTHRVSYTACLNMLQKFLNRIDAGEYMKPESSENLDVIIDLITNENFLDYLTQIVEQKLQILLKTHNQYSIINIYDPESYNSKDLFKFLSYLWRIFWQKIHGVSRHENRRTYDEHISIRYSANYLNKILKYQKLLTFIWNITANKFSDKLINLFQYEGSYDEVMTKAIEDLKESVKNYYQEIGDNVTISIKILSSLFAQLFQLIDKCEYKQYEQLVKWLLKEADKSMSVNIEIGSQIIKLVNRIDEINSTPILHIKYFASDFECCSKRDTDEVVQTNNYADIDTIQQFNLYSRDNSLKYFEILIDKEISFINQFEWFLNNNTHFNDNYVMKLFYHQIYSIINVVYHNLQSIYDVKYVNLLMELLAKFYNFMSFFIQHRIQYDINLSEKFELKRIITLIANRLQMNLSYTFNRIQNYMLSDEQQRAGKADANEISSILRYKHAINNLINRIDQFEQQLNCLKQVYPSFNFMENYTKFVANIEIKFQSRVTRTISEQQINKIIESTRKTIE